MSAATKTVQAEWAARVDDAKMARLILREVRFTLAQAKGYIAKVSAERSDGGGQIVAEITERLGEVEALQERFGRVLHP